MTDTTTGLYSHRVEELAEQMDRVADNEFYRELYADHDVDPTSIGSMAEFQQLPFVSSSDLRDAVNGAPDRGPFFGEDVNRTFMTPVGDQLMPLYYTAGDWRRMTETIGNRFRDIGVGEGDVVLNTIGYTPFIAGMLFQDALSTIGAVPVPAGAGDSDAAAGLVDLLDVNVAVGFPSYIEKIAAQTDMSLDILISAGEPVVYYPSRREELREVVGGAETVADVYGIAEAGTVAAEDATESGMNVFDEYMIAEVIDPETGDPVAPGESGELVLTHLHQEAMPMVRFRTGDVTRLIEDDGTLKLPEGVFGRVDNRLKVKGIKVYPGAFEPVVAGIDGLTGNFTIHVSTPESTDHVRLVCEGVADQVDVEALRSVLRKQVLISVDDIEVVESLETDDQVVDDRAESIT